MMPVGLAQAIELWTPTNCTDNKLFAAIYIYIYDRSMTDFDRRLKITLTSEY